MKGLYMVIFVASLVMCFAISKNIDGYAMAGYFAFLGGASVYIFQKLKKNKK